MNHNSEKVNSSEGSLEELPSSRADMQIKRKSANLDLLVAKSAEERNRSFLRQTFVSAGVATSSVIVALLGLVSDLLSTSIELSPRVVWASLAGVVVAFVVGLITLGKFSFGRNSVSRSFADVSDFELRTMVENIAVGQVEFISNLTSAQILDVEERNNG